MAFDPPKVDADRPMLQIQALAEYLNDQRDVDIPGNVKEDASLKDVVGVVNKFLAGLRAKQRAEPPSILHIDTGLARFVEEVGREVRRLGTVSTDGKIGYKSGPGGVSFTLNDKVVGSGSGSSGHEEGELGDHVVPFGERYVVGTKKLQKTFKVWTIDKFGHVKIIGPAGGWQDIFTAGPCP